MFKNLNAKGKIILIILAVVSFGIFFRISLEKYFYIKQSAAPITPPIDAKDEANRLIQKASENFFYHEFGQSVENYKKAIALFEKRGNLKRAARTYESIGDTYKFSNNSKEAEKAYLKAVDYHKELHSKIGEGRAMKKMGEFYMQLSRLAEAGKWFNKATAAVQDSDPHVVKAKIYEAQGHYLIKTKRIREAIGSFEKAKNTYDKIGYPLGYDNISPMIQKLESLKKNKLA